MVACHSGVNPCSRTKLFLYLNWARNDPGGFSHCTSNNLILIWAWNSRSQNSMLDVWIPRSFRPQIFCNLNWPRTWTDIVHVKLKHELCDTWPCLWTYVNSVTKYTVICQVWARSSPTLTQPNPTQDLGLTLVEIRKNWRCTWPNFEANDYSGEC